MKRKSIQNSRKMILAVVLFLLVFISIGYAYLNANLSIGGNSNIKGNTWDIHFENVSVTDGSITPVKAATIDNTTKQTVSYTINLSAPGQYYEFVVSVVNAGTIDGKLGDNTTLIGTPLTEAQKKYLDYTVTYENGNPISKGDALKAGEHKNVLVRVEFKPDVTADVLPQEEYNLSLKFGMNYIQDDGTGNDIAANK